jgi:16S rRNA C1402 (ribose-2'-O) methylase RsmI
MEHFTEPRGEFTLVIEGQKEKEKPLLTEDVEQELRNLRLSGIKAKEAVARVAGETGLPRKELYRTWLMLSKC